MKYCNITNTCEKESLKCGLDTIKSVHSKSVCSSEASIREVAPKYPQNQFLVQHDPEVTLPEHYNLVGVLTHPDFQKCKFVLMKLHRCFPENYPTPKITPMLLIEWEDYLKEMQRTHGTIYYGLKKPFAIYLNNKFFGNDENFFQKLSKKFIFSLNMDFACMGMMDLMALLKERTLDGYRQMVYFTIAAENRVLGTLLFQLFNDIAPMTCENFVNRCTSNFDSYLGKPIHRIVKNNWIQCGGWDLRERKILCENYVLPHDRRGVLSMCNSGRHKKNSTQFFISLTSAPWMDRNYVAFGQLIEGGDVLNQIEKIETKNESPLEALIIVKCGEFKLSECQDGVKRLVSSDEIEHYLDEHNVFSGSGSSLNTLNGEFTGFEINLDGGKEFEE